MTALDEFLKERRNKLRSADVLAGAATDELAALRSRLAEAEGVAKAMAGLIGGMEDDDPWIFSKNGGQEIMQAYEAYKSKHGQVVGT